MNSVATKPVTFDGRVPYPSFASIETTAKCNLQCPMCLPYLAGATVLGPHMEMEAFEKVARALFPYVDWFQLTVSGEPLMSRGLNRMLELAEEYGVRAEYYTNGTLLNDRTIAMVLPTLGNMFISFDGATAPTFEKLRAGATFDRVVRNVERLMEAVRKLPIGERPVVGFNVTVMESNVRELPAIIELAHRLGLDLVALGHVFAVVPEVQRESLAHHVELAREWIGKALDRARELGIAVTLQPLDQVMVAMAQAEHPVAGPERAMALTDGVVEGLEGAQVNWATRRLPPPPPTPTPSARKHVAARRARRARAARLTAPVPAPSEALPDEIWHCDFLWNRIYVMTNGSVRPCCVPGAPDLGVFKGGDLDDIWDNEAYRAMRIGLVRRDPVAVCRGCQHIQVARDKDEIARLMQGRALPEACPIPPVLRPLVDAAHVHEIASREAPVLSRKAPTLTWPADAEADGYAVRAATEGEGPRLTLDTASLGIGIREPRWDVPRSIWEAAPYGQPIAWKAVAHLPHVDRVVARGFLLRR